MGGIAQNLKDAIEVIATEYGPTEDFISDHINHILKNILKVDTEVIVKEYYTVQVGGIKKEFTILNNYNKLWYRVVENSNTNYFQLKNIINSILTNSHEDPIITLEGSPTLNARTILRNIIESLHLGDYQTAEVELNKIIPSGYKIFIMNAGVSRVDNHQKYEIRLADMNALSMYYVYTHVVDQSVISEIKASLTIILSKFYPNISDIINKI